MHQHKILPQVLLILSLINVLPALAAPVEVQEVRQVYVNRADVQVPKDVIPITKSESGPEKRWDEYSDEPAEPLAWQQKRGTTSSSMSSPAEPSSADQKLELELASNPPPSSQTGARTPGADSTAAAPVINERPPSDGNDLSSGSMDHGHPSNENLNYHPSDGPVTDLASNEGTGMIQSNPLSYGHNIPPTRPATEPSFPLWDPNDWSTGSSEPELKPNTFMGNVKDFFIKTFFECKFCHRGLRTI